MVNWLQKFVPPPEKRSGAALPVKVEPKALTAFKARVGLPNRRLPNASIVYAIAGVILVLMALFNVLQGRWITGILVLFPAACFFGYAWYYAKYAS